MSVPLVLRKADPDDTWWELVDPADARPVATVRTRSSGSTTTILSCKAEPETMATVLGQLVVALRRTDTGRIVVCPEDPLLVAALTAEGFAAEGDVFTLRL